MDEEKRHIVQAVALSVTDLSEPVLMTPPALAQGVARAALLSTEDVPMVTSATDNASQESPIVHGSPKIATLTMAPGYTTQDLADQETRKEGITGEQNTLVIKKGVSVNPAKNFMIKQVVIALFYMRPNGETLVFLKGAAENA